MDKHAYSIKLEQRTYPSGRGYWLVLGPSGDGIGHIWRQGEDYVTTHSKRAKPFLSLGAAARHCVKRRVAALRLELSGLLQALVEPQFDRRGRSRKSRHH